MSGQITRRESIRRIAAGSCAALAGVGGGLVNAASTENIRWGQGAWMWAVKHRPGTLRITEMLDEIKAAGYTGVEGIFDKATLAANNNMTLDYYKEELDKRDLVTTGSYLGDLNFHVRGEWDAIGELGRNFINRMQRVGGDVLILGPPPIRMEDGPEKREAFRNMAECFNEAGKWCADRGIKVGLHPHANQLVMTAEEIDMIFENTDPRYFHMIPDVGHLMLGGCDPLQVMEKYKERIVYMHIKDAVPGFESGSIWPFVKELGRGEIDFPAVMRILKSAQFNGWLIGELDFSELPAPESIGISMKYIRDKMLPIYR
jgi:inosose dehydratase